MKRTLILLTVCSLLLLAGCGASPAPAQTAAPAAPVVTTAPAVEESAPPAETAAPALPSEEEQRQFLMDRQDQWRFPEETADPWFYAFTDLDHNGRLEVLTASTQGSGIFTYAACWEVNAAFDGLDHCTAAYAEEEFFAWPEIIVEEAPCYYDGASGLYHYLFTDLTREGAAHHYETLCDLVLSDGKLSYQPLASRETHEDVNGTQILCSDAAGNAITEAEFEAWAAKVFAGMEQSSQSFAWTQVGGLSIEEILPDGPEIVITKHPTGEVLSAGGNTWFIAHADNADTLTWMLVSPDGVYYALEDAEALMPGLRLEVLPKDTLGVSNVPEALDGWGVVAWFFGPGGTAETSIAYITVE